MVQRRSRRQIPLLAVFLSVSLLCVAMALVRYSFLAYPAASDIVQVTLCAALAFFGAAVGIPIGCWRIGGVKGLLVGAFFGATVVPPVLLCLGLLTGVMYAALTTQI